MMTKVLRNILFISTLIHVVISCFNNDIPKNEEKVLDCSDHLDPTHSVCELTLVVAPLMSMTYYENNANLVGYRAKFLTSYLTFFDPDNRRRLDDTLLKKPITVDGEFRPIITINGQMPGPTIIAEKDQWLYITVYNKLPNGEGISIHWHGMHQSYTSNMDGVAHITQQPIVSYQNYTYKFRASPAGTHWYHAHSGAHRTDGLYGALIVKDVYPGELYNCDLPEQHTLLLMDWQKEPSIDLFYQIRSSMRFTKQNYSCSDDEVIVSDDFYPEPYSIDGTQVSPIPFWSGIINDKGRHYDEKGELNEAELNLFRVTHGYRYRFRLIGAQALQAYRFSIQNHLMTVIATDGNHIKSISNVHYVIVNSGERFDVVVNANQPPKNYWILAETLENSQEPLDKTFHNPVKFHKAEAILHYEGAGYSPIAFYKTPSGPTWNHRGLHVNCPFYSPSTSSTGIHCINTDQFSSLEDSKIDNNIYNPEKTFFYNFGFDGEKSTNGSSVDGINFLLPSYLPYTKEYENANLQCPGRGCDHENTDHCACTQVIDITDVRKGQCVELVITNYPRKGQTRPESSHPVHLHGHSFSVVKIGYPNYQDYRYSEIKKRYKSQNSDIICHIDDTEKSCERFITVDRINQGEKIQRIQNVMWSNNQQPEIINKNFVKKDTVIVPFGGYVVIRFIVDNPGWWFFHCHIEIHQLEGMAAVIKELNPGEVFSNQASEEDDCVPNEFRVATIILSILFGICLIVLVLESAVVAAYCYFKKK